MTVNTYFVNGKFIGSANEQNLVESNIIETIQLTGQNLVYMQRAAAQVDNILNEAPLASFGQYSVIEGYLANFQDFGGNQYLLSKFGLDVSNKFDFIISKKRFDEEVGGIPKAGDLIYLELPKILLQIDNIDAE